jgi:hypothetical protein
VYTLKLLFPSKVQSYGKRLVQIVNHGHDSIFGGLKPDLMSNGLWEVVRMCWAVDPARRPSMEEVDGMLVKMREDK